MGLLIRLDCAHILPVTREGIGVNRPVFGYHRRDDIVTEITPVGSLSILKQHACQ